MWQRILSACGHFGVFRRQCVEQFQCAGGKFPTRRTQGRFPVGAGNSSAGAGNACEGHHENRSNGVLGSTLVAVIPGRGLLPASPESITTGGNDTESIGVMESGLAQERAPR